MPRYPIDPPIKTTPHGAYGYRRTKPGEGTCAGGVYPCTHLGVDLAGEAGDAVFAPDAGAIVAIGYGDKRPFRGYGPGVVLIETPAKKGTSFPNSQWFTTPLYKDRVPDKPRYWHLLAHLSGKDLLERWGGQSLEIGARKIPVKEGDQIGVMSDVKHVHWEVRTTALGSTAGTRTSPALWLARWAGVGAAAAAALSVEPSRRRPPTSAGGGGGALLVLGLLMMERRRGR